MTDLNVVKAEYDGIEVIVLYPGEKYSENEAVAEAIQALHESRN